MIEPATIDEKGKVLIARDGFFVHHLSADDVEGSQDLKRLLTISAWPSPGEFTLPEGSTNRDECLNEDVRALFKEADDRLDQCLNGSVYFINEKDREVVKLFILSTYFTEHFRYSPRLILSGTTGSGKTRVQKLIRDLSYRGVKLGNTSFPAMFRMADEFSPTLILEESQDISGNLRNDLMSIAKEGFEKGDGIARCNVTTMLPEYYNVYSPLVLSTKRIDDLAEDVINRSFVITMVEAPPDILLNPIIDEDLVTLTRQALYHLMFAVNYQHEYTTITNRQCGNGFDFVRHLRACEQFLVGQTDDESFEFQGAVESFSKYPRPVHRQFDIATTMFPLAALCNNVDELMLALRDSDSRNKEALRTTMNTTVFNAWAELIEERMPTSKMRYLQTSHHVYTREIRDKYVQIGTEAGTYRSKDEISTRSMRGPLTNMGFQLSTGGTNNLTYVIDTPNYQTLFETNLRKFGSKEHLDFYSDLPDGSNSPGSNKPDLPSVDTGIRKIGGGA